MSNYGSINDAVEALLQQQVADGQQTGVQVCAYKDGVVVVDTCAGRMGPNDSRPVQADSLFLSFSMTKGVAATVLHMLADKGLIEYNAPVARYWPGFAANGKEKITVAQAMSHQAGLHAMPTPFKRVHLTDWEAGIHWIEQGVPAWEPGTDVGYHAVTFSWIVGGIIAGATGRHIKDVIRSEIAQPLGIADEMFGERVEYTSEVQTPKDKYRVGAIAQGIPKKSGDDYCHFEMKESLEHEQTTFFAWEETNFFGRRTLSMFTTYSLEPIETGTKFILEYETEFPFGIFGKFLEKVYFRSWAEKQIQKALEKLKNILEQ